MTDKTTKSFWRQRFRPEIVLATTEHRRWVDEGGLHSGEPGPLDELIGELEAAAEVARKAKTKAEEEDE